MHDVEPFLQRRLPAYLRRSPQVDKCLDAEVLELPAWGTFKAVYLCRAVNHSPAHLFLGGIRRIAAQITEVLYTGNVDVARGNLNTIFVVEQKGVIITFGRIVRDDGHFQVRDIGHGHGNIFRNEVRIGRSIYFYVPFDKRSHFPFDDTVPYIIFFAYNGYVWSCAAARRKQHCQNKQVQRILIHNS